MAARYIIAIFHKIEDSQGNNVLTGLTYIPCFNKVAYFKSCGKYYRIDYPDVRSLRSHEKKAVYASSSLHAGIYGTMAECYGKVKEIDMNEYKSLMRLHPVTLRDKQTLGL